MAVPWPALLVSFVVPLVWAPYMAAAMRRSSLEIGDRAMRFMRTRRASMPPLL